MSADVIPIAGELPIRTYMRRYLGETRTAACTDEELIEVARRAAVMFNTTFAGADLIPIVEAVKGWGIHAEVGPSEVGDIAPEASSPRPEHPGPTSAPSHRPLGWRYQATPTVPTIDATELLDFERDHPLDTVAKWRQVRALFGRARPAYMTRLWDVCETPEAKATHPDVVARVISRRDELRARRDHPAGHGR